MKREIKQIILSISFLLVCMNTIVTGTPSTQIWIISTDLQKFKTLHLGIDNYFRLENQAYHSRGAGIFDCGLTAGVLPFKKLQAEVGIDYLLDKVGCQFCRQRLAAPLLLNSCA